MPRTIKLLFLIMLCSVNAPVWAHHGAVSTFRFVDGLMHPWSGIDHWLVTLGLALFLYRRFSEAGYITILALFGFCQSLAHATGIEAETAISWYVFGLVLSNSMLICISLLAGRFARYVSLLLNRTDGWTNADGRIPSSLN